MKGLYLKSNRYYWWGIRPGEAKPKGHACIPAGQKKATQDPEVAQAIVGMWHAKTNIKDHPAYDGTIASLCSYESYIVGSSE